MAPDARILSVKVGAADGGVDVTQVIAAIDWVVQHQHDNGLNIRVLNLSYGTNSTQPYTVDPLAYAAEQAWKHGIVVVAAAGNSGYQKGKGAPGLAIARLRPVRHRRRRDVTTPTTARGKARARTTRVDGAVLGQRPRLRWLPQPRRRRAGRPPPGTAGPGSFVDQSTPQAILDARTSSAAAARRRRRRSCRARSRSSCRSTPTLSPDQVKKFLSPTRSGSRGR